MKISANFHRNANLRTRNTAPSFGPLDPQAMTLISSTGGLPKILTFSSCPDVEHLGHFERGRRVKLNQVMKLHLVFILEVKNRFQVYD